MIDLAFVNSPSPLRVRSSEEGSTQISWWTALVTLVVVAICLLGGLAALGLVGPDEPRYMAIARVMSRSGDWVTPRLYGQPWFEKPVLYYWAAGIMFRLFGVGEFAARLPAALAALLATTVMAWAALRSYGLDAAWLALVMLPTTVVTIGLARAATPDMLFSALLAAAAVSAAEMLEKKQSGQLARLAFGVSLGAATLAKGPAAVVLAAGAVFLWALISGKLRAVFRLAHPVCIAAFLVVAAPWYVLCAWRNPEFLRVFIVEQNFSRYFTIVFDHVHPFWFFGPILLAATVPWTILLLPLALDAFARVRRNQEWKDSPALFFGCWAVFPLFFFSFSQSKLPGYVLPAVPPLILLLATTLAPRLNDRTKHTGLWLALVACAFPALPLAAVWWLRSMANLPSSKAPLGLLITVFVGTAACVCLALAGQLRTAFAGAGVLMAVMLIGVNTEIIPKVDPLLSPRTAARATPQEALSGGNLAIFDVGRAWEYGLDFYLDRALPEWSPNMPAPGWVWTTERGTAEIGQLNRTCVVVVARISPQAWLVRIEK